MRTDRDFVYFKGDDNPHLAQLLEILTSYSVFENGVGYTQGMSDLLSPLMAVIKDEAMVLPPFPSQPPNRPLFPSAGVSAMPCLFLHQSVRWRACMHHNRRHPCARREAPASIHGTFP